MNSPVRTAEPRARTLRVPLTPLIDVVFILLLFFMLSSSFVRHQQIEFGAQPVAGDDSQPEEPRRVLLFADGRVRVAGEALTVSDPALDARLAGFAEEAVQVVVTATPDTPMQALVSLLDRVRAAGVTRLDLSESHDPEAGS